MRTIVARPPAASVRLDAALRFGAALTVNTAEASLAGAVREATGGAGVGRRVGMCRPPASVRGSEPSVRWAATRRSPLRARIDFPIDQIFYKQLTLSGSICYTARTWEHMMRIYQQGRIRLTT